MSIICIDIVYKKENPEIFKFPFTICSINDVKKQKVIYDLYDKFLNLDLEEQTEILANNKYIKKINLPK